MCYFGISVVVLFSSSRNSGDHSLSIHCTDTVIFSVSNIKGALIIDYDTCWPGNTGSIGRSVIAHHKITTITCHGGDDSLRIDPAHPVITAICYIQISFSVESDSKGFVQSSLQGGSGITFKAFLPVSRIGTDIAIGVDRTDAFVGPI